MISSPPVQGWRGPSGKGEHLSAREVYLRSLLRGTVASEGPSGITNTPGEGLVLHFRRQQGAIENDAMTSGTAKHGHRGRKFMQLRCYPHESRGVLVAAATMSEVFIPSFVSETLTETIRPGLSRTHVEPLGQEP